MLIYLDQCYRDKRLSAIKISDKFLLAISVEESFVRDRFFFSIFFLERFFFFLSSVETLNRNLFGKKTNYDISR